MGKADIESDVFRRVMGHFPTGVTVVAARDVDGEPYGLTVNSFTSVSLDPPLVLVCIDRQANSHDRLVETRTFAVSVLAANQAHIAARFASAPSWGRFEDLAWGVSPAGDPIVEKAAAWVACSLMESHEAGDHTILVGRVESVGERDADALIFHRGRYRTFAP
jgi:3-hydroxy-9,10-secoandrosta-1,3,5(10)-triene-9,17-dione monooxygenase reductase component